MYRGNFTEINKHKSFGMLNSLRNEFILCLCYGFCYLVEENLIAAAMCMVLWIVIIIDEEKQNGFFEEDEIIVNLKR